jgi:hypothetical protein
VSESNGCGRGKGRRRERRNGHADGGTHAHSTLSAETTHVQVFYPFHPLHRSTLQIVRRPKRGDGAASVIDPQGEASENPCVDAVVPGSAEIKIAEQPYLSKKALLSLTSLVETPMGTENRVHANLLPAVVDTCKGGQRAATTTPGPGNRDRKGLQTLPVRIIRSAERSWDRRARRAVPEDSSPKKLQPGARQTRQRM